MCSSIVWVYYTFRVYSGIVRVFYYVQPTTRVDVRVFKEHLSCALVYSECTLVCSTFRLYSGIVYSIVFKLLSEYISEYSSNTQDVL